MKIEYETVGADQITIFHLHISEGDVRNYKQKQMALLIVPLFFYYFADFSFYLFQILLVENQELLENHTELKLYVLRDSIYNISFSLFLISSIPFIVKNKVYVWIPSIVFGISYVCFYYYFESINSYYMT